MVFVDYFNDKDETETINYIASIIIKYRPKVVSVETNSIGNVYYGLLKKENIVLRCQNNSRRICHY